MEYNPIISWDSQPILLNVSGAENLPLPLPKITKSTSKSFDVQGTTKKLQIPTKSISKPLMTDVKDETTTYKVIKGTRAGSTIFERW